MQNVKILSSYERLNMKHPASHFLVRCLYVKCKTTGICVATVYMRVSSGKKTLKFKRGRDLSCSMQCVIQVLSAVSNYSEDGLQRTACSLHRSRPENQYQINAIPFFFSCSAFTHSECRQSRVVQDIYVRLEEMHQENCDQEDVQRSEKNPRALRGGESPTVPCLWAPTKYL